MQNHVSRVLAKLQVRDRTQAALRMRGLARQPMLFVDIQSAT